jgi:hypothetical protein
LSEVRDSYFALAQRWHDMASEVEAQAEVQTAEDRSNN